MGNMADLERIHEAEKALEALEDLLATARATQRDGRDGILGRGAGGRNLSRAISFGEDMEDKLRRAIAEAREEYKK